MAFDKTPSVPEAHNIGEWGNKYRFADMSVGDSIYVASWNDGLRLRRAAAAFKSHHPDWQYRSRRETDAFGFDGIRVWRTA